MCLSVSVFSFYALTLFCILGVEALKLPEEGTVRSAGHFLSSFILLSRDASIGCLQPVVAHNTETLLRTLMFCICMYIFFSSDKFLVFFDLS